MGSDAEPVLQKAMHAVAMKNAIGMSPSKEFVTFPALSNDHFLGVAADSSLVFDSSFGSPKQILLLMRAKEIAQDLLAEAICKAKLSSGEVVSPHLNLAAELPDVQRATAPGSPPCEPGSPVIESLPSAQKRVQGRK
jgi:hypothetical protein